MRCMRPRIFDIVVQASPLTSLRDFSHFWISRGLISSAMDSPKRSTRSSRTYGISPVKFGGGNGYARFVQHFSAFS